MTTVKFKKLHSEAQLPAYETAGAAGMDIRTVEDVVLIPGEVYIVRTGLAIEVPVGLEAQVRPRSGLAAKHSVTVLNSPGTIDSDFRGEMKVILFNHGLRPFPIKAGDRIAQLVIAPVIRAEIVEAEELSDTIRGAGGFGSTGQ